MTEKLAVFFRRFPRLTRGQRLARNVLIVLALILAVSLWDLRFPDSTGLAAVFPRSWRFRLEERRCLLAPSEIVADLSMEDAIDWDPDSVTFLNDEEREEAVARLIFTRTYGDVRFLLGRRADLLHIFESGFRDQVVAVLPAGPGEIPAYLYRCEGWNDVFELAELIVYSDLPAVRVEAELAVRDDAGDTVLRGGRETEDGACLLIAQRTEEEPPPEAVFEKSDYWLRVRLLDENGAVLGERSGNVEYRGGWIQ